MKKHPRDDLIPGVHLDDDRLLPRGSLDVVDVVDGEWSHQDAQRVDVRPGRVLGDRVVTKSSSRKALALDALDGTGAEEVGNVVGQIAKIDEAPEGEFRCAAVLGVLDHLRRYTQTGDLEVVTQSLVLDGLGGSHDADRGR